MPIGRRDFLTGAAITAGAQFLANGHASAATSDTIRVAIIGLGGRGRDHMRDCAKIAGVKVVAFCDPDETRMAQRAAEFESLTGQKPRLHQDLRQVLDNKEIDAVTIATCNHWHALATIWACQAGKHVYVEKPVCHDFFSGAQMVAASRKYDRLVQGGTQRRSSGYVRRAIQALREGNRGVQQGPVQIDDDCLAFAGEVLLAALHADDNAQGHTSTSSGFPRRGRGSAVHFWDPYPATPRAELATPNVTTCDLSSPNENSSVVC